MFQEQHIVRSAASTKVVVTLIKVT